MEWPSPELKYLQAGGPRGLQALLEERIQNYREAAASAKEAGEAAKARRCERGLKVRLWVRQHWHDKHCRRWPVFQQGPGGFLGSSLIPSLRLWSPSLPL